MMSGDIPLQGMDDLPDTCTQSPDEGHRLEGQGCTY